MAQSPLPFTPVTGSWPGGGIFQPGQAKDSTRILLTLRQKSPYSFWLHVGFQTRVANMLTLDRSVFEHFFSIRSGVLRVDSRLT